MIRRVQTCDLPLGIEFPAKFGSLVDHLTKPFVGLGGFRYMLHLSLARHPLPLDGRRWNPVEAQKELIGNVILGTTSRIQLRALALSGVSAALGLVLAHILSENDGIILHAAGVLINKRVSLFVGKSGSGKSTIIANLRSGTILHDDRMAVRRINGQWQVFGVPLRTNHFGTGLNIRAPLGKLFLISKGSRLAARPLAAGEALRSMAAHTMVAPGSDSAPQGIALTLLELVKEQTIFRLSFPRMCDVTELL